jgi:environmental stress-induced protein Ves
MLEAKQFNTQRWSGGSTTEMFIFPEKTSYAERNFDFRLSMATVEVEASDFTPLPGIFRKTLILDGEITLTHKGEAPQHLGKHAVASYEGAWETKSVGRCTDFNLMTRGTTMGSLEGRNLEAGEQWIIPTHAHTFLYVYRGRLAWVNAREAELVHEGTMLVGGKVCGPHLLVKAMEACEVVVVQIMG